MISDLKPYPSFKDSGLPWLGDMPEHWELVPNRSLIRRRKVLVGKRHPDYRLLSLTKEGVIIREVESGKGKFSADMGTSQEVRAGDLIFCLFDVPETPRTVGLSRYDGMITGAYTVFECSDSHLAAFFELFYRAMDDRKLLSPLYSGLRNTIPPTRFLGIKTPVPPAPDQTAIVRFVAHADRQIRRYIQAKQKLLKLMAERREAVTENALKAATHSIRIGLAADRIERPINREDDQIYTPIGLYNRGRGIFHKEPTKGSELGDSDFFWIAEGDLVLSGQFAWEGAIALAGKEEDGCVATHRYPILRGKPDIVQSAFLLSFLRTAWGQVLLNQHSRGAAGRNRPLNADSLMKEKVPIPPLAIQNEVAAAIRSESRIQQSVGRLIVRLREYRARLLADVVTGKLDVREAAARLPDEPLEVEPLDELEELPEDEGAADDEELEAADAA
jgi:type I restriction enzyme S subunit